MSTRILTIVLSALVLSTCSSVNRHTLRDGDILFQDFASSQSEAVKIATGSEYSHCGVVFFDGDRPMVWEAVQPVTITPLTEWIGRDIDSHYVVMRLRDGDKQLSPAAIDAMKSYGRAVMGRDYDALFEWSDDRFYCSELVWKIYSAGAAIELCPLRPIGDYSLENPVVREKLAERYGDLVPLDRMVVAPSDLYNSPLVELVYRK